MLQHRLGSVSPLCLVNIVHLAQFQRLGWFYVYPNDSKQCNLKANLISLANEQPIETSQWDEEQIVQL